MSSKVLNAVLRFKGSLVGGIALVGLIVSHSGVGGSAEHVLPWFNFILLAFVPGYIMMNWAAIFLSDFSIFFRAGFSVLISMTVIVFMGVVFDFAHVSINKSTFRVGLMVVMAVLSVIDLLVMRKVSDTNVSFSPNGVMRRLWRDRLFVLAVVVLVAGCASALFYDTITWNNPEAFTEFSIVRSGPSAAVAGHDIEVAITNQENRVSSYEIRASDSSGYQKILPVGTLENGITHRYLVTIPGSFTGTLDRVKIELWIVGESNPYRELHLWLNPSTQSKAVP